jgi:serpin B
MNAINQWGCDHTMGMIPSIFNEQTFNPFATSYLLNAVYFKGLWTLKFNKNETQDELFDGTITIPMMHLLNNLPYYENAIFQAVSLPYGTGAYQMTVILPREGKSISDILPQMNSNMWQELYTHLESVDVKLPHLDITTQLNLVETMSALGMPSAFNAETANIPNFCSTPQYISNMGQVAKIKLDEDGTEAAAITWIETETGSDNEPVTYEFHANRPFLYVISEQSTGVILFIGQFTGKNATGNIPSGVKAPTREKTEPSAVYDLSGRRLKGRPAKGFYISDGRKIIR